MCHNYQFFVCKWALPFVWKVNGSALARKKYCKLENISTYLHLAVHLSILHPYHRYDEELLQLLHHFVPKFHQIQVKIVFKASNFFKETLEFQNSVQDWISATGLGTGSRKILEITTASPSKKWSVGSTPLKAKLLPTDFTYQNISVSITFFYQKIQNKLQLLIMFHLAPFCSNFCCYVWTCFC